MYIHMYTYAYVFENNMGMNIYMYVYMFHNSCFTPARKLRELRGPNGRGRPRADWLKSVLEEAWYYASQLQNEHRRQDLEGDFIFPHSTIPLSRAAANTQRWNNLLAEVPTRREENFDQAL